MVCFIIIHASLNTCYPNSENNVFIMGFPLEFIRASVLCVLLVPFSSLKGNLSTSFCRLGVKVWRHFLSFVCQFGVLSYNLLDCWAVKSTWDTSAVHRFVYLFIYLFFKCSSLRSAFVLIGCRSFSKKKIALWLHMHVNV